jgi:hypothetical protein
MIRRVPWKPGLGGPNLGRGAHTLQQWGGVDSILPRGGLRVTDEVSGLPDRVVAFLRSHVRSILQLEALLLVFEAAPQACVAYRLALQMYLSEDVVAAWLDGWVEGGFCEYAVSEGYRVVADDEIGKLLGEVATTYLHRPVSVGRCIFAEPDPKRSLAEAFRVRPRPRQDD